MIYKAISYCYLKTLVTKLKMKYNMKYEFNFITKIYIMA